MGDADSGSGTRCLWEKRPDATCRGIRIALRVDAGLQILLEMVSAIGPLQDRGNQ